MKKVLIFSILICALLVVVPCSPGKAYQMDLSNLTDDQLEDIGSLGMGYMITNGDAEELDFSESNQDVGFLKALGLSIVTEDPTYIAAYGLNWGKQKAKALVQTCKDWVEENLTWLYDAWYGTEHKVIYHAPGTQMFSQHIKELMKDRSTTPDPVTPNPDVNYAEYLAILNDTSKNVYRQCISGFWISNYSRNGSNVQGPYYLEVDPSKYTFMHYSYSYNPGRFGNDSYRYDNISSYFNGIYQLNNAVVSEPVTIYINNISGTSNYVVTTSLPDIKLAIYYPYNGGDSYSRFNGYNEVNNNDVYYFSSDESKNLSVPTFQYQDTLENCFKVVCMNFRNVDVYVDGNLWSTGNFSEDDSIIYPIGIPDSFEILGGGVQGQYNYPTDTYWDLDGLRALIKQAIIDADVVTYADIAPLIVDVNGQQAVATLNVHRTDYDALIGEQYSIYPNSNNVLTMPDLTDYSDVTKFIANDGGTSLIPSDIKIVLGAFGIILLVGYLINRMLE